MDNITHQQLKALVRDEKFDALAFYYNDYLDKKRKENVIGINGEETLKLTYMREGAILALEEFFDKLERETND